MPAQDSLTFLVVSVLLAYLLGSIPFAVVVSKLMGLSDPRSYGSGNPGATNVLRSGNKLAAALTLVGDAVKGWLAMWLAQGAGLSAASICWIAFAVFAGHLFPVFLKFKGGKGVATAIGIMAAISPLLALLLAVVWVSVVFTFKFSSLGAIVAAILAPILYIQGSRMNLWPLGDELAVIVSVISALLLYRHRANIQRLLSGTEPKIGKTKSSNPNEASH